MRRVREKTTQRHVTAALQACGATVLTLGTVRPSGDHPGTCMSRGWPDLGAFLPASHDGRTPAHWLWVEVKIPGGRLRPDQATFREACLARGIAHVVGGLDEVLAYLEAHGYVTTTVGHAAHARTAGSMPPHGPSVLTESHAGTKGTTG